MDVGHFSRLDNLMCNVPEVAMCYHINGVIQVPYRHTSGCVVCARDATARTQRNGASSVLGAGVRADQDGRDAGHDQQPLLPGCHPRYGYAA